MITWGIQLVPLAQSLSHRRSTGREKTQRLPFIAGSDQRRQDPGCALR